MNFKKLRPLAVSAVVVAGLTLSACGSDDKEKDTQETTSAAPTEATQEPTGTTEETTAPETEEPTEDPTTAGEPTEAPAAGQGIQSFVDAQKDGLKAAAEATGGMFTDITVEAEGDNTAVYKYVMSDTIAQAGADALKSQKGTYDAQAKPLLDVMKQAGIESPVIKFMFVDGSGKEVWSTTISE